jgi:RNA polymerase sigma factor (sigma-70 family)
MPTNGLNKVVEHLRSVALRQEAAGMSDKQLLEGFVAARDQVAFAVLVRRHAPLVWNVCRRVLTNHYDAEDAFQATFLVLVRKAAAIANRDLLANWLYGVAHRTALKARAAAAKRQTNERQVPELPETPAVQDNLWSKMLPILDQELSRLPDKYRACIVLCDLQGKTRKDVARLLRLPEGTVGSRLARARSMLAKRLNRHGLAVSGGTLAAVVSGNAESACVPATVVWNTIKAATLLAAGQTAAAAVMSATVAGLTEGVMQAMFLSKLKIVLCAVLLAVSAIALAGGVLRYGLAAGRGEEELEAGAYQKAKSTTPLQKEKQDKIDNNIPPAKDTLIKSLETRIQTKVFQDAGQMSLKEALEVLVDLARSQYHKELPILVDNEPFKAENPDAPDFYETKVQFPPFPHEMTIAEALKFILGRVDTKNATFALLPDRILITTYRMTSPAQKLNEKVRGVFEKRPLSAVLRDLSEAVGTSIVVDNRAADKAKTEVSATFLNDIDLAGALRVLTEMADLKVLVLDGTIYVTTQAQAEALRNERRLQLAAQKQLALKADPLWPYQPEARGPATEVGDQPASEPISNPERKLQEKVKGTFEKRPLHAVLQELAAKHGTSIILDARVGDKAKTEISAVFRDDVTLWGALRILTEMADLKAVIVDGGIFVTTPANAEALRHGKEGREETPNRKKAVESSTP